MKHSYVESIGFVEFPQFLGLNINMMPFIMGDNESIPEEYHSYRKLIEKCNIHPSQVGKIGYLSITESVTQRKTSQRRGGIHTESSLKGPWGGGGWGGVSGLYMASNVSNSCKIWATEINPTHQMGLVENQEELLNVETYIMKKNELMWLTDKVPHESLPINANTPRQWFRVVTNEIHGWYAKHSTENRLGVKPDAPIISFNKFKQLQ